MATTPEGLLRKKIRDYLKTLAPDLYFLPMTGTNRTGASDLICCYRGAFLAFEAKDPAKARKATVKQGRELVKVEQAGGFPFIVNELTQAQDVISRIDYAHRLAAANEMCILGRVKFVMRNINRGDFNQGKLTKGLTG